MRGVVVNCEASTLLAQLTDRDVGAIITDPPPSLHPAEVKAVAREANRTVRMGGAFVVIGDGIAWRRILPKSGFVWMAELVVLWGDRRVRPRNFDSLYSTIGWYARAGMRHSFDWQSRSVESNVIQCQRVPRESRLHPSEKPVGLTNFLISLLTRDTDLIVDPFCGRGSTLVSAAMCGRSWLGSDIDKRWAEQAQRRANLHEVEEDVAPVHLWVNGRLKEV